MTISTEYSTVIDCPIEDVFEYVSTPNKDIEWKPRVVGDPDVNGAMDVGTTWTMPNDGLVRTVDLVDTCIAYNPPTRFGYETENGLHDGRIRTSEALYTFTSTEDGTEVSFEATTQVSGVLGVLQPVFARMVADEIESQHDQLKTILEGVTA